MRKLKALQQRVQVLEQEEPQGLPEQQVALLVERLLVERLPLEQQQVLLRPRELQQRGREQRRLVELPQRQAQSGVSTTALAVGAAAAVAAGAAAAVSAAKNNGTSGTTGTVR
jgi:hypothetical protein